MIANKATPKLTQDLAFYLHLPSDLISSHIAVQIHSYPFLLEGKWLWVTRNRYMNALDFASGNFLETVSITTFGRDRKLIQSFIAECMDSAFLKEEGRTVIWSGNGGSWRY